MESGPLAWGQHEPLGRAWHLGKRPPLLTLQPPTVEAILMLPQGQWVLTHQPLQGQLRSPDTTGHKGLKEAVASLEEASARWGVHNLASLCQQLQLTSPWACFHLWGIPVWLNIRNKVALLIQNQNARKPQGTRCVGCSCLVIPKTHSPICSRKLLPGFPFQRIIEMTFFFCFNFFWGKGEKEPMSSETFLITKLVCYKKIIANFFFS